MNMSFATWYLCVRGVLPHVRSWVGLRGERQQKVIEKKHSFAEVFPCWQITSFGLMSEINVLMFPSLIAGNFTNKIIHPPFHLVELLLLMFQKPTVS